MGIELTPCGLLFSLSAILLMPLLCEAAPEFATETEESVTSTERATPGREMNPAAKARFEANDGLHSGAIEEILVTATKRGSAKLQDLPITIQAISAEQLADMRARNFDDWARFVPGLAFQDQGPGDKRYIIRGIQSAGAGTVGVYLDEAVITGSNAEDGGGRNAEIKLFDVNRIETLKGPQGTLYGASSMSGTIRIITNQPKMDEWEANIATSVSSTHFSDNLNFEISAMANIPIANDVFALRLVGWSVNNGGYIDNVQLGNDDINDEQTNGGRVIGRWSPHADLTVTASALIQSMEIGDNSRWNSELDTFQADHFTRNPWEEMAYIYSGTVEYDSDFGNFVATTNWFKRDIDGFHFDITRFLERFGLSIPAIANEPQNRRIWSNEFRFNTKLKGPFQGVVGVYYEDQERNFEVRSSRIDSNGDAIIPMGLGDPIVPSAFIQGREASTKFEQSAVFGELSYDVSDRIQALVGIRQFHSKQVEEGRTTFPFGGFPPSGPPSADPILHGSEDKLTKKVSLSYSATDNMLVYGLYSEGFRVGGLNDQAIGDFTVIPPVFEPDEIQNYEVGLKSEWLDRRLLANLSVFKIDWLNMQTKQVDEVTRFPFIGNAGEAEVKGFELEVNARPIDGLDVVATLGLSDAKLTEDQPLIPTDPNTGLNGDRIPNVPKLTASGTVQYRFPIFSNLTGMVRGDVLYRGSTATQFRRTNPSYLPLDSYALFNLHTGIEAGNWTLSAFVENVFNKLAEQDKLFGTDGRISIFSVRPRTIGLHIQRQF